MKQERTHSRITPRTSLARHLAHAAGMAALVTIASPAGARQSVVPAVIMRPLTPAAAAPPAAPAPVATSPAGDEASVAPPEGDTTKTPSITLEKDEAAALKSLHDSLPPDEQAELRAYYTDLNVNIDAVLGIVSSKGRSRAQEFTAAMRELDFARKPQAVLAARSTLGFGQVPQPNAATAKPEDVAKWIHLQVMAGEWGMTGEWLRSRPKAEAQAVYSAIVQSMNKGDPGLLPEEVVMVADAAPEDLKDWQLTALANMLKLASEKNSVGPMLAQLRAGTRWFGPDGEERRARTVNFLAAANLVIEAYEYLPSLDAAKASGDASVLLVHARYKQGLAERDPAAPSATTLLLESWDLCSQVSLMSKAPAMARREAVSKGLSLLTSVPRSRVSPWLDRLFAEQTIAPTALELMALKAATIGDEKLSVEQRAEAILTMKEAVDALLSRTEAGGAALRVPLRMLTTALLSEMESAVKEKGRQQNTTKEAQILMRAMPSRRWFEALEPSLATRASTACIELATAADETDLALSLLRDGIARSPEAATSLANRFLAAWEQRLNPKNVQMDENRMLFFFYRESVPAAPLTRGRQRRNLDRLHALMETLREIGIEARTLPAITPVFKACHGRTEVFDRDEITQVFGPIETMPAATATSLAETMAASLNGDWRNRAAQQATGTKRSDSEIAALVDRGYGTALELIESALSRQPTSWRNAAVKAGLAYDRMQFRTAQNKSEDPAKLNAIRKDCFMAFEQAAASYAGALSRGEEREDVRVFTAWFGAAMGTPQLTFVKAEEMPGEGTLEDDQIDHIRKAIGAMPADVAFRHVGEFARAIGDAVLRSDPEVKPRLVKHALRVIGDHPAGASLRAMDELYRDLVKDEIKLRLAIDGDDRVGVAKPFGMLVSLRFTNAVDRETGGFAKYLQNNVWGRVGRDFREINYRDRFQKEIEKALSKSFTIESIGFFDPFMPSRGVTEGGQGGWLEKPMAYVVLTRKDPAVDRVPQVAMDMQFDDQTGPVTLALPSNTPPLAVGEQRADRPCVEPAVSIVVDPRNARSGDKGGVITVDVMIRGQGVVPDLRDALEGVDSPIDGYAIAEGGIEAKPTLVLQEGDANTSRFSFRQPQAPKEGYPEPDASGLYRLGIERSWTITYTPTGASKGSRFTVPSLAANLKASYEAKRYDDMDLVPVSGGVVEIRPGFSRVLGIVSGAAFALAAGVLVIEWMRRRKSARTPRNESASSTRVTPLAVITSLRATRDAGGTLDSATLKELEADIVSLERRYFGPGGESDDGELSRVMKRWAQR